MLKSFRCSDSKKINVHIVKSAHNTQSRVNLKHSRAVSVHMNTHKHTWKDVFNICCFFFLFKNWRKKISQNEIFTWDRQTQQKHFFDTYLISVSVLRIHRNGSVRDQNQQLLLFFVWFGVERRSESTNRNETQHTTFDYRHWC